MISSAPLKDAAYRAIYQNRFRVRYTDDCCSPNGQEKPATTITLVFVHGFHGCLETWNLLKERLLAGAPPGEFSFRIVALDLLGNGLSDKPVVASDGDDGEGRDHDFDYTFRSQGRALVEFMKEIELCKRGGKKPDENILVLVGHSSGGIVVCAAAQQLLAMSSDEGGGVDGLFLIAPGFFNAKPSFLSYPVVSRLGLTGLLARLMNRRSPSKLGIPNSEGTASPSLTGIYEAFVAASEAPHALRALASFIAAPEESYSDAVRELVNGSQNMSMHIVWSEQDRINPCAADRIEAMVVAPEEKSGEEDAGDGVSGREPTNNGKENTPEPPFTYKLFQGPGHYMQHEIPDQLVDDIGLFCCRLLATKQQQERTSD